MPKKTFFLILIFLGVFFIQDVVSAASAGGDPLPYSIELDSSNYNPIVGQAVNISAKANISDKAEWQRLLCKLSFGDGIATELFECESASGRCSYSFSHSYSSSGDKTVLFSCNPGTWAPPIAPLSVTISIEVSGLAPEPACDGVCNGECEESCNGDISQDPDCGCLGGDGICCWLSCDFTTDSDCPPPQLCTPIQCDKICQPNCDVSQDSDCGCLGGNNCCPTELGCNFSNDSDCPSVPSGYDNPVTWSDIPEFLQRTMETVFGMMMGLAVLIIIIGGYVMATSGGIPSRFDKGRKIVIWAIVGFAIIAASRGIIALVEMIIGKQ
ncbi:hypothetical protein KJ616_00235 [Patescibacteria group bacterium]|nr:hypothetical protein [Patescibacteria group bacterium]